MGEVVKATVAIGGGKPEAAPSQDDANTKKPVETGAAEETTKEAPEGGDQPKPIADLKEAPKPEGEAEGAEGTEGFKPTGEKSAEQVQAEKAVGFDLTKYSNEFAETGKLSEESYVELEQRGITRETVDTYKAGMEAKAHLRHVSLAEHVGGVDSYNAIIAWGAKNLSEDEKTAAVKALAYGSIESGGTYLQGLKARMEKAVGRVPGKRSEGGGSPAPDVFASRADQAKAMRDPRYRTDAKYRDEITRKSIRSFGTPTKKRTKTVAKAPSRRAPKGKR
ncbi:MAG TPA: hypothetical protein VGD87_18580 [Archangium sp.]